MSSNTKMDYGFYHFSAGKYPDEVYAIALCKGDISPNDFVVLVSMRQVKTSYSFVQTRRKQSLAQKCFFRYSFRSIFGIMEAEPLVAYYNSQNVSNVEAFNKVLRPLKPCCIRKFYSQVCSGECAWLKLPNHICTSPVHP